MHGWTFACELKVLVQRHALFAVQSEQADSLELDSELGTQIGAVERGVSLDELLTFRAEGFVSEIRGQSRLDCTLILAFSFDFQKAHLAADMVPNTHLEARS